ncbi:hypothetical protein DFH29DRAFT_393209 [Suillus ampliporus]|nr:hypothetical protein DFH29DRAFT_393209 [Suillus ampliporus]
MNMSFQLASCHLSRLIISFCSAFPLSSSSSRSQPNSASYNILWTVARTHQLVTVLIQTAYLSHTTSRRCMSRRLQEMLISPRPLTQVRERKARRCLVSGEDSANA